MFGRTPSLLQFKQNFKKFLCPMIWRIGWSASLKKRKYLKDKLTAFEQKVNNRFELATRFILQSKEAKILAKDENLQSLRDCFKKVGSNFLIQNRALSFTPRGAWRILAESTF